MQILQEAYGEIELIEDYIVYNSDKIVRCPNCGSDNVIIINFNTDDLDDIISINILCYNCKQILELINEQK